MPVWLPAAIAGAASVAGAFISSHRAKKQRKEDKRIRDLEYQRYLEDFARKSPKEDMKRYAEAGLNPNLIYGQAGGQSAGTPPEMEPDQYTGADIQALAGPITSEIADVRNFKLQKRATDANIWKTHAETIGKIEENRHKKGHNQHLESLYGDIENKVRADTQTSVTTSNLALSKYQEWLDTGDTRRKTQEQGLTKLRKEIRNLNDQHKLNEYDRTINALKVKGIKITTKILSEIAEKYLK